MYVFHVSAQLLTDSGIQLATELVASSNQVVVTVDHAYQSGAIELDNKKVIFNLAGVLIKPREANYARVVDLLAIAHHLFNQTNLDQPTWNSAKISPNSTFVLGHGQGGLVAKLMVGSNIFPGGGSLDGLVGMPAPYTERNVLGTNGTLPKPPHTGPKPPYTGPKPPSAPDQTIVDRLKKMAQGLRDTMLNTLSGLMCRAVSDHSHLTPEEVIHR